MTLHVESYGDGRPLVVLPSFSLDHQAMAEVVEPAMDPLAGWMRLYLDLPGTGSSPAGEPRSDVVLDDVVATVMERVGGQGFVVTGWSYGGYLGAGLARRIPRQVRGLMMVCAGFRIRPEDRNLSGVLDSVPEPGWLTEVPAHLHEHFGHAVGCQTADAARRVNGVLGRNGRTDEAYLAALRADGFALSDEDLDAPRDLPVCFLTGRRDRVAGYRGAVEVFDRYPEADYVTIANAGHYLPLEQPGAFAAITQSWLQRFCA